MDALTLIEPSKRANGEGIMGRLRTQAPGPTESDLAPALEMRRQQTRQRGGKFVEMVDDDIRAEFRHRLA